MMWLPENVPWLLVLLRVRDRVLPVALFLVGPGD
jgi:hypothetical protein